MIEIILIFIAIELFVIIYAIGQVNMNICKMDMNNKTRHKNLLLLKEVKE